MLSSEQLEEMINRRHKVVVDYCKKNGWPTNLDNLTMEQIMEIRSQPEWINVSKDVAEGR